ncbi:unnamed protein product [Schistosoma curassoni]|uniref:Uncharacterized protein n=1 Tax=Schistosoma curassoni TaxID=6186 RepID=A0A183KWT0_9TREM|nr:unnamed protein product [Schistosoma curassoni]
MSEETNQSQSSTSTTEKYKSLKLKYGKHLPNVQFSVQTMDSFEDFHMDKIMNDRLRWFHRC